MFREDRATAAAWKFVSLHGGAIPHKKLMKLLYFADRAWLIERGMTLFEDNFCSMDEGPVLSTTYNRMKDPSRGFDVGDIWRKVLSPIRNETIHKKADLDPSQFLTRSQLALLDAIWSQYGGMSVEEIVNEAHQLPEWTDPKGSSIFIQYSTVLEKELESQQEVISKTRSVMTQRRISAAFGG